MEKVKRPVLVPKEDQGSWGQSFHEPKGRLYVSDQYGPLFRIKHRPSSAATRKDTKVEKVLADIGEAQGLCGVDSLYVVGADSSKRKAGLYRVTDSNRDDMLDTVELLADSKAAAASTAARGDADAGRQTADRICGNRTQAHEVRHVPARSGVGRGSPPAERPGLHEGPEIGPGGAIYNCSPDGKEWDYAVGFRNEYDATYNRIGDLFSYDADMEWDFNTPWYTPRHARTYQAAGRVRLARRIGKYPAYYADSLGIRDIRPG